jgi:hypothetical protein
MKRSWLLALGVLLVTHDAQAESAACKDLRTGIGTVYPNTLYLQRVTSGGRSYWDPVQSGATVSRAGLPRPSFAHFAMLLERPSFSSGVASLKIQHGIAPGSAGNASAIGANRVYLKREALQNECNTRPRRGVDYETVTLNQYIDYHSRPLNDPPALRRFHVVYPSEDGCVRTDATVDRRNAFQFADVNRAPEASIIANLLGATPAFGAPHSYINLRSDIVQIKKSAEEEACVSFDTYIDPMANVTRVTVHNLSQRLEGRYVPAITRAIRWE